MGGVQPFSWAPIQPLHEHAVHMLEEREREAGKRREDVYNTKRMVEKKSEIKHVERIRTVE